MIQITKLENGMRIVTDTQKTAESVSLGVWVNVGARYESADINGISHMLEHMAFKGTTSRSAFDISKEIEDVGGLINAYTGKDMTAYYVRVLKEHQALGLEIIADIVQHSTMDKQELQKEKGVIVQEINMQNDTPDDLVFDYFHEVAYPDQPLGRAILGTADIVRSVSSEQLLDYMHTQYTANRIIVSACGDIDHESFVESCRQKFTHISTHIGQPSQKAIYVGGDKRVEKPNEQVNLVLGFEGFCYTHPDYYVGSILSGILGGGMSSRLFQEIREKRGLVYSIYAFNSPESDTGTFGVYAGTGEKEVKELMPVLCDELLRLPTDLTDEEINRTKARLKARVLMRSENFSSHAEMNAIDMITQDRCVPKQEVIDKIQQVSKDDLVRVAHQILKSPISFSALGPVGQVMRYDEITSRLKA